ncbi:MAG: carbon storage regulator CsrA [Desulfobaccales bacterium]
MLILTRKINEGVIIGNGVRVVVLAVRGRQVRLGVEAPVGVVVLRHEIFERLLQENRQATVFVFSDLKALQQLVGRDFPAAGPLPPSPPEVPRLRLDRSRLGEIEVPEDRIIFFPQGLLGFTKFQRFALLAPEHTAPFLLLLSLENPDLALLMAEPSKLGAPLEMGRLHSALQELEAKTPEELQVFVPLTIPPGRPAETTANLVSPILINPGARLGRQLVSETPDFSRKHSLLAN